MLTQRTVLNTIIPMSKNNLPLQENKMGTMPVTKLILNMSLPMMFSMFIQALYNIVDSVFVAQISENALTAVSLAFPVQNLMISVAVGTSVGVNALLSMRLGEKNRQEAEKTAMNGLFLSVCSFMLFFVLGILLIPVYLRSQTSNQEIIGYGLEYLYVVALASPGLFAGIMCDRLLQSTGRTMYTMYSQISGALTNIILDPLLIFGIGFFPEMGVYGAAVATVAGQIVGLAVSVFFNLKKNPDITLSIRKFRPDPTVIGRIYRVGIPSIILSSVTSVTTYFMNLILGSFSSTAIAVYGVYFKLNSFIFMPVFGLNNGIVPIIAYNYGARNKKRITQAIRTGLIFAIIIMSAGTLIFELIPGVLLRLFAASDAMLSIGIPAMRIIASSFIGAAVAISLSSVFQAFGKAFYSMIVSIIRQIVFLLPAAWLLSLSGNINMIWFCFPIAEVMSVALSLLFMRSVYRNTIAELDRQN